MKTFLTWCKEQSIDAYVNTAPSMLLEALEPCRIMWIRDEAILINGHKHSPDIDTWDYREIMSVVENSDYMIFYESDFGKHSVLFNKSLFVKSIPNNCGTKKPHLLEVGYDGLYLEQPYNATTYYNMFNVTDRTSLDLSDWDFSDIECLDNCFSSANLRIVNIGNITKDRFPNLKSAENVFGPNVQHREMMQEHLSALCI